ncbi:hypothetical protein O4H26_06225 [Aequorivita viscosa]|nr:hypothetical protein [Aequorivita viscosa]
MLKSIILLVLIGFGTNVIAQVTEPIDDLRLGFGINITTEYPSKARPKI